MSDTIPNIKIPAGTQSDVYALASVAAGTTIAVGTALRITMLSNDSVNLCTKATAPLATDGYIPLCGKGNFADTTAGESGLWAYASPFPVELNVQVLP